MLVRGVCINQIFSVFAGIYKNGTDMPNWRLHDQARKYSAEFNAKL